MLSAAQMMSSSHIYIASRVRGGCYGNKRSGAGLHVLFFSCVTHKTLHFSRRDVYVVVNKNKKISRWDEDQKYIKKRTTAKTASATFYF